MISKVQPKKRVQRKANENQYAPKERRLGSDVRSNWAVSFGFASLELVLDEDIVTLINEEDKKIGETVLMDMNSFPAKIHIFKRLVTHRVGLDESPAELKSLCSKLELSHKMRNDIVHSTYSGIAGEEHKLYQRWPKGRKREKIIAGEKKAIDFGAFTLKEEEIEAAIDIIEDAEFELLTIMSEKMYPKVIKKVMSDIAKSLP